MKEFKYKQIGRLYELRHQGNTTILHAVFVCKIQHDSSSHEPCMMIWLDDGVISAGIPIRMPDNPMHKRFHNWSFLSHEVTQISSKVKDFADGEIVRRPNNDDNWLMLHCDSHRGFEGSN